MQLNRNKLYLLLGAACMAGYAWLYWSLQDSHAAHTAYSVCLFKHVTGWPCPSCGSTRAVMALLNGELQNAWYINPLGYVISGIMLIAPVWILADIARNSKSLLRFYQLTESKLRKPGLAIPLAALLVLNWLWNINKGL